MTAGTRSLALAGDPRRGEVEFRVLGPLEVRVGERTLPVRSPKHRVLLARLLLDAGRPVETATLAAAIWGDHQPGYPRRAVQLHVTRLRSVLAAAGTEQLIRTWPNGYSIEIRPEQLDLGQFCARLQEAQRAAGRGDGAAERAALEAALAQWRGDPFTGVGSEQLYREMAPHLREQWLRALGRRIDLDLRSGRGAELVGQLQELTARYPLREAFWAQLVRALDASGRRSDALSTYHQLRRLLAEELGIEPGEELRELYADLLATPTTVGPPVPRELLPAMPGFVGRSAELTHLDALVAEHDRDTDLGVRVVVISGTAGVGKTALAVHWSRRMADAFPDGQLWVNLRGYHPGQALTPERALARFLRSLGVPAERIPLAREDLAGRFRSLLDGRRMLVVLDNALTAEQVRPLLPGSGGCLVLVTSRSQLTGLVVTDGAEPMNLDLLTAEEARQLLEQRLGRGRVSAHPVAAGDIIGRCARLPLALAIVAARAANHPQFGLDALAAELADAGGTATHGPRTGERSPGATGELDAFATGEDGTDLRSVFSWSYHAVSPAAALVFRRLGMHPGPELAVEAAASLTGMPAPETRALLTELVRAHLVAEPSPGRFLLHDLLRSYAAELAYATDSVGQRREAVRRLADHYLHTATAAARLVEPHRDQIIPEPPVPGVALPHLAGHAAAVAWFTAEHAALHATVDLAAGERLDTHAWQLGWALATFLDRQGRWNDLVSVQQRAVQAALRLGDPVALARAHRSLGIGYGWLGNHAVAHTHFQSALAFNRQRADRRGEGYTQLSIAWLCEQQGRLQEGLAHARQALDLFCAAGQKVGQARALNSVGWHLTLVGEHRQALTACRRALALLAELGDRESMARTWDSLGVAHHHLGAHRRAAQCYRQALDLHRELGNRYFEGDTLAHLGDTLRAADDLDGAQAAWRCALDRFVELGHPDADRIRARLASTPPRRVDAPGAGTARRTGRPGP